MDKNLERDFEEFKQALANVEAVYKELEDCVDFVGGLCKDVLYDVKRAPLNITTIDKVYDYMNELNYKQERLQRLSNVINAELHNALVYYDSLESEYY